MKLLILGCGTSTGVPVIGCSCPVCISATPRNIRTRSSVLINTGLSNILIDTSTDLRAQALSLGITKIDAVLFTHPHADHIHGIDELRSFNMIQGGPIPCFGNIETVERIKTIFNYIFNSEKADSITPQLSINVIEGPFTAGSVDVIPIEARHGRAAVLGFRIGDFAYMTDCSEIPPDSMKKLLGLDVLVLDALRFRSHPTHMNIDEAIEVVSKLAPKRTILTHLSHDIDYMRDNPELPEGMEFAFDGMVVDDIG